ncbi:TATA-box-binding protein-like 1 [Drosophila teissieri]|uniref:TATA-box-binding protein-like 1 n=1 Tax=Drosophila teissieri TaxID=7243 RepID=UPI001CB9F47E|nr:TATA-box-binding protein-like 1 [Drosophila teissieri]
MNSPRNKSKRFKPMEFAIKTKVMKTASKIRETLFDPPDCHVLLNKAACQSEEKSLPIVIPRVPRQKDVLSIYENVAKLADIERYLNILYKPFYCLGITTCQFSLSELDLVLENTTFEPEKQMAVLVQRYSPICSLKIYPHGNIYCQAFGSSSAREGMSNIMRELRYLGYRLRLRRLKVNAVNATFSVPFHLSLRQFHQQNPVLTRYDTSMHPFLMYKMMGTTVEMAIFPTGYVIVLFATTRGITQLAIAHILPILYRLKDPQQDQRKLSLSSGDVDYKLLWENHFQKKGDMTNDW